MPILTLSKFVPHSFSFLPLKKIQSFPTKSKSCKIILTDIKCDEFHKTEAYEYHEPSSNPERPCQWSLQVQVTKQHFLQAIKTSESSLKFSSLHPVKGFLLPFTFSVFNYFNTKLVPLFSGEFQQVIDTVNVFRLNWKLIKILRWLLISSWKKILLLYIGCVFLLIWHTGMHILGDRNCFTWHISFAECSFLLGEGGGGYLY